MPSMSRRQRVTEIQRGMRVVAQDFAQIAARAARDTQAPASSCPRSAPDEQRQHLVTFTRNGWSNPAGIQRPAEQRVRYRFIDGSLVREHWLAVDPALNTEPRHRVLLTRVKAVEIRFLDPVTRNWRKEWPKATPTRPRRRRRPSTTLLPRPLAIEFTVVLDDWGRVHAPVRDSDVRHARQRGMALLVAIVMFAIATTVAAAITYNKAMAARRAAATFTLEQALQAGMAAEALADIALESDGGDAEDHADQEWAQALPPPEIEGTGIWIRRGRRPVRALQSQQRGEVGAPQDKLRRGSRTRSRYFRRLLRDLDIDRGRPIHGRLDRSRHRPRLTRAARTRCTCPKARPIARRTPSSRMPRNCWRFRDSVPRTTRRSPRTSRPCPTTRRSTSAPRAV